MTKGNYSIGEFAKKTSTTIRTLHHYDNLGLLKPSYVNAAGRRFYSDADFVPLQRILTLKYLGYSLEEIKQLLESETWNLKESLQFQQKLLQHKKNELEKVMKAIHHALHVLEDQQDIDPFIFISLIHNIQREDDHKDWLKNVMSEERVDKMFDIPEEKQLELEKKWADLCTFLKNSTHLSPEAEPIQDAVAEMMAIAREITGDELALMQEVANVEVPEEAFLFHSPFTPEEEAWLAKAVQFYLETRGIDLHGEK